MKRIFRDLTIWALLGIGLAFLTAAIVFYRADAAFLESAVETTAVVVEKNERADSGNPSDSRTVRYEWQDTSVQPPVTRRGSAAYAGGEDAFEALVPGESTVRIAWRPSEDGRSVESKLVEDGFTGMPWSLLFVGAALLTAVPIRAVRLYRIRPGRSA